MAQLIMCNGQLARNPYFYMAGAVNLYSIEELSYYICNNVYSIDDSLMSEQLISWVEFELKLPKLAKALQGVLGGFNTISGFVRVLLESGGYCNQSEIESTCEILDEIGNKSEFFRRKNKADSLLKDNKLMQSIEEYKKLLNCYEARHESDENVAAIWHNMATAYGRMFFFHDACKCYERAYNLYKRPETRKEYILCLYYLKNKGEYIGDLELYISDDEYKSIADELDSMKDMQDDSRMLGRINDIDESRRAGMISQADKDIDDIVHTWKIWCRNAIE